MIHAEFVPPRKVSPETRDYLYRGTLPADSSGFEAGVEVVAYFSDAPPPHIIFTQHGVAVELALVIETPTIVPHFDGFSDDEIEAFAEEIAAPADVWVVWRQQVVGITYYGAEIVAVYDNEKAANKTARLFSYTYVTKMPVDSDSV